MTSATRRGLATLAIAGLLATSGAVVPTAAAAQTDEDAAQRAAAEIAAARERANAAAAAYLEAESQQAVLELDRERLTLEVGDLQESVAAIQEAVEAVAVARFVSSGSTGIPILTDLRVPADQLQAGVLADVVSEASATSIDDLEQAQDELADKRAELEQTDRSLEQSKQRLLDLQAEAEAEVERLREIEAKRLEDEAVVAALLALQREQTRQLAEMQRRQAEAARAASPDLAAPAVVPTGAVSGNSTGNIGASGGEVGGRTGGGGSGTNPRWFGDGFIDRIKCPVLGGSGFVDSWGFPRSGGRRHQGVDMLAPTGTQLVAVVSGFVTQTSNRLGGTVISLAGDNGNRYYYAHLSGYEGPGGPVAEGQVIGYIGDSGNATGVPHLHFEIRPGGGVPVNPYPSVVAAGC